MHFSFSPSLLIMQILATLFGFFNGVFHTASNVLLLDIWKGHNASPYMYTMHFSFSVGALLAPLVARPFLREDHGLLEQSGPIIEKFTFWQIRWLYPLVGLATVVLSPGYLAYYLGERQQERKKEKETQHKA